MILSHNQNRLLKAIAVSMAIVGGVALSTFNRWEPSGETWGYWFFARLFAESGSFVIPDRSPLYTLYLNGFRWLGYPEMVIIEYIVTSSIAVLALVILLRPYLGLRLSVFAVLLWIPFLQVSEPPVQTLALACSCFAIVARRTESSRFRSSVSYTLLGFAYMFRSTYIIMILLFAAWDVLKILKKRKVRLAELRPRLSTDWPVLCFAVLFIWFLVMQSPHAWNNAWFASTTWFPGQGKSLTDASIIQHYNWGFIETEYGTFEGRDFYFTNKELFGGATTLPGAIVANPRFVIEQTGRNFKSLIHSAVYITMLPKFFSISGYVTLFIFIAILYGGLRALGAFNDESIKLFMIGNIALIGVTVISLPKERYLPPFIPLLIMSAHWYGMKISAILIRDRLLSKRRLLFISSITISFTLLLFSTGAGQWSTIIQDTVNAIPVGKVRVMENPAYPMKASYEVIRPLVQDCKGVMSLEHTYIGAFMNVPLNRVYDVWEIPPFGRLGDPVYDGLRPDRIDCILISNELATGVGMATNFQIRYQNYIRPYVEQLEAMNATTYQVKSLGKFVALSKSNKTMNLR